MIPVADWPYMITYPNDPEEGVSYIRTDLYERLLEAAKFVCRYRDGTGVSELYDLINETVEY